MREVTINGTEKTVAAPTVDALVTELGFTQGTVLVEQNGIALRPDEWAGKSIEAGDRFELMRIVAGG